MPDAASSRPRSRSQRREQRVDLRQRVGALDLRHHDRVEVVADDRADVVLQATGVLAVDADDDERDAVVGRQRLAHGRARRVLLVVGDRVLEVEDDRVGPEAPDLRELARVVPRSEKEATQWLALPVDRLHGC